MSGIEVRGGTLQYRQDGPTALLDQGLIQHLESGGLGQLDLAAVETEETLAAQHSGHGDVENVETASADSLGMLRAETFSFNQNTAVRWFHVPENIRIQVSQKQIQRMIPLRLRNLFSEDSQA